MISRETKEVRLFVAPNTDAANCLKVIKLNVPADSSILYTDEWRAYHAVTDLLGIAHSTVRHGKNELGEREWARDDNGDGKREVHCNSCEGNGAAVRTFLRSFRGVHKQYLHLYLALFQSMHNAKLISSSIIRRMCFGFDALLSSYT